jgi:molybdate transport system substrate-binding protein
VARDAVLLLVAVVATVFVAGGARAAEITCLWPDSWEAPSSELRSEFARSTGHHLNVSFANLGTNAKRIRNGELADLIVVSPEEWERLAQEGKIRGDTRVVVAKVGVGMFVGKGARRPDIATVESLRQALLNARAVALRDPSGGSPVGTTVIALLKRLGIADEVRSKRRLTADRPFRAVVGDEAEFGFSTLVEIAATPDVDLVGPVPAEVQRFITQVAAIPTAAKEPAPAMTLLEFLRSPRAVAVLKARGFSVDAAP